MRKILLSLSSIAAVAAIVAVGSTGAWWSDTAESSDNTFNSGSMDLELRGCDDAGNNCDNWRNDVTETWDYENMYPGGDKEGSNLLLKNAGDTPADWLKFKTDVSSSDSDLSNVMRITEFSYAGESLLEDGAGADLSKYEGPEVEDCDVIVDGEHGGDEYTYIQKAVEAAESGDLVCVRNGDYSEDVEVNKNVVLATFNGADNVTLDGIVKLNAEGATIKGFKIVNGGEKAGGHNPVGIYFAKQGIAKYNVLVGNRLESEETGIMTEPVDGVVIENNELKNWFRGVYLNPGDGNKFNHNLVHECDYGVSTDGQSSLSVRYNEFDDLAEEIIGASDVGSGFVVRYNNILTDAVLNQSSGNTVNARYNWWGQATGAEDEQTEGDVNTEKHLGGPHVGFVNGEDHNDNGFADLNDLHRETVVTEEPQLEEENYQELYLETQLDGPTAENEHQGESVDLDMEIIMGQGPVNQ